MIILTDIVGLHALFHLPHGEDTVLVAIAQFPVLPGSGVEVEVILNFNLFLNFKRVVDAEGSGGAN